MVEVTTEFMLQVLGAKVVELEALRAQAAQLEQQAQQQMRVQLELDEENERLAGQIAEFQLKQEGG